MRIKPISAAIAGSVLALVPAIPAAQAYEVDAAHQSTSAISAQTRNALEAQWRAEARGYKVLQAQAQAARALGGAGWNTEAKYYG
jgi:hypothetical protein